MRTKKLQGHYSFLDYSSVPSCNGPVKMFCYGLRIFCLATRHMDFPLLRTLEYITPTVYVACAYVNTIFLQKLNCFSRKATISPNTSNYKERHRIRELRSRVYSATLQFRMYEMHLVHNLWLKISIIQRTRIHGWHQISCY